MLRRVLPRFHLFRVNAPILPTATRLGGRPVSPKTVPRTSFSRLLRTSPPRLTSGPSRHTEDEDTPSLPPDATVSQRLKHLVKSYGWYALGIYLVFSALDFTVAFVGIKLLGAEQVSQAAAYVKQVVIGFLYSTPTEGREEIEGPAAGNGGQEGLFAMLALAYTIHKTVFLPVRVGLTATLTPRIVGWLRARGWAGGEAAKRAARERIRNTGGGD
ncbi:hypothetical protein L210DRAFT_3475245 [Boletus edulis BED1]|uniref:DUF1279 domain-containing protein n=1 Tax=Boletus edulis BED1 TaxID=1328754 RepID=A0AAD4C0B1_BOLED|nr:hypothetical protein L210DRAFT_3475245 [Boletus edulis BED1]